jgi:hypothetical protein
MVGVMAPTFNAVGLAVADMAASLSYRRLGLKFPAGAEQEPHVETTVAGGVRLMWDTHQLRAAFVVPLGRGEQVRAGVASTSGGREVDGPDGDPRVVHVDQERDYRITVLAPNFASFIRALRPGSEYEDEG